MNITTQKGDVSRHRCGTEAGGQEANRDAQAVGEGVGGEKRKIATHNNSPPERPCCCWWRKVLRAAAAVSLVTESGEIMKEKG